jgi:hypothetical protein
VFFILSPFAKKCVAWKSIILMEWRMEKTLTFGRKVGIWMNNRIQREKERKKPDDALLFVRIKSEETKELSLSLSKDFPFHYYPAFYSFSISPHLPSSLMFFQN